MSNEYKQNIAHHYAAYRPPLHSLILNKMLATQTFELGLDVGSGTGQSSLALAQYCTKVQAIEPSAEMLSRAIPHLDIQYRLLKAQVWPVADHSFDIITFAGSLFYAKSQSVVEEIKRVGKMNCMVLVYDFEIPLHAIISIFGILPTKSDYDHAINFSGLNTDGLVLIDQQQEAHPLKLTAVQLAHLLLSEQSLYSAFAQSFRQNDPFPGLVDHLQQSVPLGGYEVKAALYYTHYQLAA